MKEQNIFFTMPLFILIVDDEKKFLFFCFWVKILFKKWVFELFFSVPFWWEISRTLNIGVGWSGCNWRNFNAKLRSHGWHDTSQDRWKLLLLHIGMEVSSIITPRQPLQRLWGRAGGAWRWAGRSCRGRCCCTSSTSVWSTVDYEGLKLIFWLFAYQFCW